MASMVVIFASPTEETGVTQERTGLPLMCTVQAPHRPMPQPNLAPFSSSSSRSTQSSGVSASTSTVRCSPLTLMVWLMRYLGMRGRFARAKPNFRPSRPPLHRSLLHQTGLLDSRDVSAVRNAACEVCRPFGADAIFCRTNGCMHQRSADSESANSGRGYEGQALRHLR